MDYLRDLHRGFIGRVFMMAPVDFEDHTPTLGDRRTVAELIFEMGGRENILSMKYDDGDIDVVVKNWRIVDVDCDMMGVPMPGGLCALKCPPLVWENKFKLITGSYGKVIVEVWEDL